MPHLFCFGLGYSALTWARDILARGWQVTGTCRDPDKAASLAACGVTPMVWEAGIGLDPAVPEDVTHVLVSVPPDASGDPVARVAGSTLAKAPALRWLGYLSTTGVYGDRAGGWVDEDAPPAPTTERGHRRLHAENHWLALWRADGLPVHIFRLAGIYGPGRNQLEAVIRGTARRVIKPGQVFSRIHVADIAAVLDASAAAPNPGRIYNVCDDEAAPPEDVVSYAAALLGLPEPPAVSLAEAGLSAMGQSFYADNKRVRNHRIRHELGVDLAYPTYREGLSALYRSMA